MEDKRKKLENRIDQLTKSDCCVAFSGGVDSSLLLKLALDGARKHQTRVAAVMFDTVLHPSADKKIASDVAKQLGAEFVIIPVNELEDTRILNNPKDRCYLCKRMLFRKLSDFAKEQGMTTILEGTNLDDTKQYRPGIKAVDELGIKSPLREAGFSKAEVRAFAAELGISVSERPSAPCLATRLPYGTRISLQILEKIEAGEVYLRGLGFTNVRLRLHGDVVRLEIDKNRVNQLISRSDEITEHLKKLGFRYITVDLEGFRSGSMDI